MYTNQGHTNRQIAIMNTFRKLWEQHSIWTRSFIISDIENLKDLAPVTDRLLRNPADFGRVLSVYYGSRVGNKFEELLRGHLLIAADLVNAAKAGDSGQVELSRRKWYANADGIAAFLASINPYWSEHEWKTLLYEHLGMVEKEAVLRLTGNYASDIALYDSIEEQALRMADLMSSGIIKQFKIQ